MNDKRLNGILLAALLTTALAVAGVHLVPNKKLILLPSQEARIYLHSELLADNKLSAEWLKDDHTQWRCNYPKNHAGNYFPCSFVLDLSSSAISGMDLSTYTHLNMHLNYEGTANKVRIAIRNYNSAYSTPNDDNSSKFNSIQIESRELNKENRFDLSIFTVADWWLAQYNIPLSNSAPELNNAKTITIDFGEELKPGPHTLTLNKLEFEGEWINLEYWYLTILCIWMAGIFAFSGKRLITLTIQARSNLKTINELSDNNERLQEETDRFRKLSTVDPLTQTYNRFGVDQIVASISGGSHIKVSSGSKYALMLIDIDHFKRINDQRGHDAGDRILQGVAHIIQEHSRAGDFVGRWGGEEFIVIMPNASENTAMGLAEIIRDTIFNFEFEPDKPLTVSASFGVSQQLPQEDFASCFKRTDNALYKAKFKGRNCCILAEDHL
jgi:diguanylate cyclase (GGDEF)-like protein